MLVVFWVKTFEYLIGDPTIVQWPIQSRAIDDEGGGVNHLEAPGAAFLCLCGYTNLCG